MTRTIRRLGVLALLTALCGGALAQNAGVGSDDGTASAARGSLPELFERINDAPAIARAGLKAALLRQAQKSIPFVLIVDDAPSYLYAISQWELLLRFPVLWDDGTLETRENIARFVRAYKPDRVLRLTDDAGWSFPSDREAREKIIDKALARALNEQSDDWRQPMAQIYAQGVVSPGVVLTDAKDGAWAGALALSAGRLQPIGYATKPSSIYKPLEPSAADALERELERLAQQTGRSWRGLGDEIDAVTLAMNTGTQIKTGPGARDRLATSDRLGRREHNGAGDRWAYCGQLIGNEAQSVYRAMCALFLELDQAFIWDGYGSNEPWVRYDGTAAAEALRAKGLEIELHDQPKYRISDWRLRMVRPVGEIMENRRDAVLFLMNSKGAAHRFDLPGSYSEEGTAGDMPMLRVPAAVHLVHSFSLQSPYHRRTVGGRLLERGVYVYAGSVDEPYLGGFVPTPTIAQRLSAGLAFAMAVRFDNGQVWKIAVLGDPLVTVGGAGERIEAKLAIGSLVDLEEQLKQRLQDEDFTGAIENLVLLGRDEDAARLAIALMRDRPKSFTPEAALLAMGALQRAGEFTAMVDCFELSGNDGRANDIMRDYLWLTSSYLLARSEHDTSLRARVEALLRANLRNNQRIDDAERLAMAIRNDSLGRALGLLEELRADLNENQRKVLDRAIARVKK